MDPFTAALVRQHLERQQMMQALMTQAPQPMQLQAPAPMTGMGGPQMPMAQQPQPYALPGGPGPVPQPYSLPQAGPPPGPQGGTVLGGTDWGQFIPGDITDPATREYFAKAISQGRGGGPEADQFYNATGEGQYASFNDQTGNFE